ncbi:MAG: InlB B-repeat-containing protein [Bacteroidaceae bacterium]|nr:InlB B-repeat-containing protein [Bacteroidaceae bacterium]
MMDKIMNKIRLISWLVCLLFPFGYLQAQETHWNCNIADYEFDMTMYLNLQIDGQVVTNLKGYEVAAFCGEECRGIATVESIDGATDVSYYYLRVRSNQAKGESYVIKVYEKETGKEFTIDEKMEFVSQSVIGYPSTPKNLEYKNTYRLVFVVDGNVLVEQPLLWGSIVTVPQMPTKEGHTFSGWSEIPETMPAKDVTVEGSFTVNHYTLLYMVDGAEYKKVELEYGANIIAEAAPTKEGHTFSGWSEIPATMPASNVTVTGTFTANSYKVTYILDGETFKTEQVVYGTAIPTPEVPAKPGYNFSGWGEVPATMPAKDLTFTGNYTINKDNKFNVIYMVDGTEYKRIVVSFGDPIEVLATPVKEGHTFSGWSEVPETMPLHDVTVTGSFTANSYQLTYILDGVTFKTETVVYGTVITAPEAPAKEGYTFNGWTEVPATMPAKDVTVTGGYTINKYTLTYTVDGTVYKTSELEYGASIIAEAAPTKEGHTFSGWSEVPATMPASNVTVTGTFTANSYKVTYILDGETFKTEQVVYGTAIPTPEVPAKPGYNFSGWGEVPATMPAQDLTFSGSYTINKDLKYNLVYMVDGVEYKRVTIAFGDVIVLDAAPVKEGHTFSGWSEVPETMPLHDVTVTGSFTANSYQLTYILDGTTFKTETVVYGTAITAPEAPTKEGHTFSGWSEIPETMPAKDVTVEGTFTINRYTLLYMVDGAEYKKVELEYGANIIAEAIPAKEGHTFSGWSEIPATMPAQDVTVTGSFTVNSYTITYRVDGEVYATEEVAYGEVIVLKEAPEKDGYIFSGWSEVPETMPAADLEVTGSFASSIKAVIIKTHVDVYSLQGMLLKRQILVDELKNELPQGLYIVDGKKVLVK